MFVCVALSLIITMCYVCIPYFTRSRVPSHISVATSVGNKSIGSMWRERFGLYFPNDETPNLVCLFLAFPHFLSCFPIFFSYFFYGAHVFFSCSSHRSFGRTSWFYWYFCEGFQKVMLLWRCWSGLVFSFNLTFCRNFRIRFQLQVPWEWLEVEKLQYNFKKEVLGYDNTMSPGVSFELFYLNLVFSKLSRGELLWQHSRGDLTMNAWWNSNNTVTFGGPRTGWPNRILHRKWSFLRTELRSNQHT